MKSTTETLVTFSPRRKAASKFQPRTADEYLKVKIHLPHIRVVYERRELRISKALAAYEQGLSIRLSAKRNNVPLLILQQRVSVNARRLAKVNPYSSRPLPLQITYKEEVVIRDWVVEQQIWQPISLTISQLRQITTELLQAKRDSKPLKKN